MVFFETINKSGEPCRIYGKWKKKTCLPFHYLWGCGYNERMWEAGSIQCNYISPRPVFLAILPGSLFWKDGNIGRIGIQWVKYRQDLMCHRGAQMRCHTRPVGRLTGLGRLRHPCGVVFFSVSHPHKYIKEKKGASSDVCSYNTAWKLSFRHATSLQSATL